MVLMKNNKKITKTNYFSYWLKKRLYENRMSVNYLSNILHIDKTTIYCHIKGETKPTFSYVIAYCWAFGLHDNPKEIYKLVDIDYL